MFCLVFNELPFWDESACVNEFVILDIIHKTELTLPQKSERQIVEDSELEKFESNGVPCVSTSLIEFMLLMLKRNPKERSNVIGLLEHPLMQV